MIDEFNIARPKTHVEWILGNNCNYKCSYCHEMFRMGDKKYPSKELIIEVCQDITYHFDELGRDVVFNFIGGEPTLAGSLGEIGKRLSNHPINMVLRTNGSASLDWWRESRDYLSDVIISVHREFCDLNHIEQVIKILQNDTSGYAVNVKVLIPVTNAPQSWDWGVKVQRRFSKLYNVGELQLLYSNFARGSNMFYPYTGDQWLQYNELRGVKSDTSQKQEEKITTVIREQPGFAGYTCYAGIDTLAIDHHGKIWRGWCSEGGPIGNIYELPISWPTEPIICSKQLCGNGFDQQARKEITSS